jgi:hypothetical protein
MSAVLSQETGVRLAGHVQPADGLAAEQERPTGF